MKPLGLSSEATSDNVVSTQKIHGGCLKITSTDTELVFSKSLPIFVVFLCGLVFVYSGTLANLVLFYYMIEHAFFYKIAYWALKTNQMLE